MAADKEVKFRLSAQDDTSRVLRNLGTEFKTLGKSTSAVRGLLGDLGVGLGGALAGVSFAAIIKGAIDSLDALNDLRDATGSSVENISALEDIAARTGTSFDTVGAALGKFNKVLTEAKDPGSEAAQILEALGLNAEELRNLDPAEALQQAAKALAGFANDGERARAVQQLFGKSVREIGPLLADLAEAGQLNATVTAQQAQEAEKFSHALSAIEKNALDVSRALASSMLPTLNGIVEAFRGGASEGDALKGVVDGIGAVFRTVVQTLTIVGANVSFVFAATGREIGAIVAQIAALARMDISGFRAISDAVRADGVRARAELDALERRIMSVGGPDLGQSDPRELARRGRGPRTLATLKIPDEVKPTRPGGSRAPRGERAEIDEAAQALARYVAQLDRELQAVDDLTEEQKALNFLRSLGSTGEIEQVRELVLGMAQQKQSVLDQADAEKELNRYLQEQAGLRKQIDETLDNLSGRTEEARKRALTERLQSRLSAGENFSPEELDRIVKGIGGVNEKLEQGKGIAEELGLSFSSAFEDAIVHGGKLSDVLDGLGADITRIVTRKLVTEPLGNGIADLFKSAGGSGGGGGDLWGKLFGQVSSFFGGFFAEGGYLPAGKWGIAGERGPEPIFGGRSGMTIHPASAEPVQRPVSVVNHFAISGAADVRTQTQLAAAAGAGVQRALARNG